MSSFEEISMELAALQVKIGELSMKIAEITMLMEETASEGASNEEVEQLAAKKSALEKEMQEHQVAMRKIMVKMEELSRS